MLSDFNNPALESWGLLSSTHGAGVEHHHGRRRSPAASIVERCRSILGCGGRGRVEESTRGSANVAIYKPGDAASFHWFRHTRLGENVNITPSLLFAQVCPEVHRCSIGWTPWTSSSSRSGSWAHHGRRSRRRTCVLLSFGRVLPPTCCLVENYRWFSVVWKVNLKMGQDEVFWVRYIPPGSSVSAMRANRASRIRAGCSSFEPQHPASSPCSKLTVAPFSPLRAHEQEGPLPRAQQVL